jgi:drug/metabolite transporter (DMT)-like permease
VLDVIGLYLLCMTDASFSIQIGDTLVILCAVAFAGQMVAVDNFIDRIDGIKLSCIQFLFSGLLGIICMFIFEGPVSVSNIMTAWFPILYAGVISCGIAYTFQVLGQKEATPTIAALILCLESVFGVLAGAVILGETMTMREIFGCIIMFAAVVISNLPEKSDKESVAVE